jgi:LacI family transcriptional regulator
MAVTLKDVARKAGVSIPTVSLILSGRKMPFRESTRRTVLAAIESLNYRPDSMARRNTKGTGRRDAVGLLLRSESPSRVANTPAYEFICGINDVLMEQSQFLVMMKLHQLRAEEQSGAQPRIIAEHFVDGLIVESGLPPELEQAVARYAIPSIWLNSGHHDASDCVYPDEVHAGRLVTEHLIGLGHRRIVFAAAPGYFGRNGVFSVSDREAGYAQAMRSHRLEPQVLREGDLGQSGIGDVRQAILESRRWGPAITAVVTFGFMEALNLRYQLLEAGVACPRELSLMTAEDLHLLRRSCPEMGGITCERYQMGRQAAEMMLAKISSAQPQPSRVFRGSLIEGNTTAAAPASPAPRRQPRSR